MKTSLLLLLMMTGAALARAQKVDSICFHLYTDSLKKGTYNYINVDAKRSDNSWMPMTAREIIFTSTAGRFEGNSLYLDDKQPEEKITVKAVLRENPAIAKEVVIYIKKLPDNEPLKSKEEVMQPSRKRRRQ
ncbi:MAG TPA: hypothetical protein VL307_05910 [Chitinophagaceae bacterium]|nr:hypothetical protein [Chitinophagaceae bacterium]